MEHMTACKFLCLEHFLSTNDTGAISIVQFFVGGIFKEIVHGGNYASIAKEVRTASLEFGKGYVEFADDMEREAVIDLDIGKEENVDGELTHVTEKFRVECVETTCIPAVFKAGIDEQDDVFENISHEFDFQDGKLKCKQDKHGSTGEGEGYGDAFIYEIGI